DLDVFACIVDQLDLRTHDGLAAARLGRDHHQGRQAGDLVELLGDGNAFFDVLEADAALVFAHAGTRERIPRGQTLAGLDGFAVAHGDGGAVGDLVTFTFAAIVVEDDDLTGARNRNAFALGVGDVAQADRETDGTRGLRLDRAGHGGTRGGPADVEGTHRQLRARLTDGLSGDDTDRFAAVDHRAAAQIAAIAVSAQTVTGFAGERRADLDFVHTQVVDEIDQVFVQQRAGLDGRFLRVRIDDIGGGDAAQDTRSEEHTSELQSRE